MVITMIPIKALLLVLAPSVVMASQLEEFAKKGNEFAFNFYSKAIQGKENDNVILSPFSVQTCVALAHAGAGGSTAEEIAKGLRLISNDRAAVGESFKSILDQYADSPLLKIANKVYVKQGYELKPEFTEIATKSFHSEAENIDFEQGDQAARTINSWVEGKTNNKIKDLVSPDSFNADSRVMLVNAIYFKGLWEEPFRAEATKKDDFWISETESVQVDMMRLNKKFKYGVLDELKAQVLELPYANSNLSMLIILPDEKTGLKDLEANLGSINLAEVTSRMYKTDVDLRLPKFKVEFQIELNKALQEMGMTTMFESADFSNLITSPEPLRVSEVIHKAFIEVNEEGTEAAAATEVLIMARCLPIMMPFRATHPFLFMILENHIPFFLGRFRRPAN